ncbi:hypothetical protein QJS10_CPA06g01449 [Acorus calamus]|uniref:Uncharacterized protein n=1 Tax=Acorus calamus TaxID=4465 RepID=A0AAV9EN59_ACOCL|nr:hypothetical protein QJS10_CPA06g01449 [Acorus calamus]
MALKLRRLKLRLKGWSREAKRRRSAEKKELASEIFCLDAFEECGLLDDAERERPLKEMFPELFEIALNRTGLVKDFWVSTSSRGGWRLRLRRRLNDDELLSYSQLFGTLANQSIDETGVDSPVWTPSPSTGLTVKKAYNWMVICIISQSHCFLKMKIIDSKKMITVILTLIHVIPSVVVRWIRMPVR